VEKCVDVDSRDADGRTALSMASQNGHEAAVRLLLGRQEIDVRARDDSGRTAYSWAVEEGHEAVRVLLEPFIVGVEDYLTSPEQPPISEPAENWPAAIGSPAMPSSDVRRYVPSDERHLHLEKSHSPMSLSTERAGSLKVKKRRASTDGSQPPRSQSELSSGTVPLAINENQTVHICATIGERGATAAIISRHRTAPRALGEERTPTATAINVCNLIDNSMSSTLSLRIQMTELSPQITIMQT
jgi:hypothetical protein